MARRNMLKSRKNADTYIAEQIIRTVEEYDVLIEQAKKSCKALDEGEARAGTDAMRSSCQRERTAARSALKTLLHSKAQLLLGLVKTKELLGALDPEAEDDSKEYVLNISIPSDISQDINPDELG